MKEQDNREKEALFQIDSNLISEISENHFDSLTFDSSIPSLVLFGARRCSVCKEILHVLEDLLPGLSGKIKAYWVDVDVSRDLMRRFRLRGIPTLLLFSDGAVKDRIGGLRARQEIMEFIKGAIK